MKRLLLAAAPAALCALLFLSPAAYAKNDKGNNGHGHGHWKDEDRQGGERGDRDILRDYVIGHYRKHCPPGLAKKNPPCVPPGQAKKYNVGSRLPQSGWEYIPGDITSQLTPPPRGERYTRLDKNVYLITEGTRKVVEAIDLFSEVR